MSVNYPNISLPKIIEEVVTSVSTEMLATMQAYNPAVNGIYYQYGNWKEVSHELGKKMSNEGLKDKIFPLIILIEDITIDRTNGGGLFGIAQNVNIVICYRTLKEFSSAERESKTFSPMLRPLYHSFLKNLQRHAAVSLYSERDIAHRYTERKYWGMEDYTADALGDYIDAIEISQMSIPIDWSYCQNIINANIT